MTVESTGLSAVEARRRLDEYGRNELPRGEQVPWWRVLASQFASPVIWLLGAAAVISGALGELADAGAIGAILGINAVVGHLQESRAARSIDALRSLTAPRAQVVRDGQSMTIVASLVVPGDVLVLAPGDIVAADARLVEAHALATNEAALTGESAPVRKSTAPALAGAPLAEQRDRVFQGTSIAAGAARAIVTATGPATELGRIATLLETTAPTPTPLQRQLAEVTRVLLLASMGIVAIVALIGLLRGAGWFEVFLSAVALAVAAIPEGLPTVITVALALGVRRMAARNALVRKLPAVETLGCTTVICTDKTGTLTTGVMTVRELWGPDHARLLDAAAACCDADLGSDGAAAAGDPTEVALLAAAAQHGIDRASIERARPRREVVPFDPATRFMAIRRADDRWYVKGATEVVLVRCSTGTEGALATVEHLAGRGLRVLAVAVGPKLDGGLELLGLIGSADPPRPEVIGAVAAARSAGIRTLMITGDHPATAAAIAREVGIVRPGESGEGVVHARATPEDKLRIVREHVARDEVVAMTGDGVNDAPALREAHVGIAMGRTATEVTREVSDVVLADDNFASIVAAIREGRGIFDNLRKVLVYLLAGNVAELAVMLTAAVLGLPLPLLPLQLLWINLVTDGLPALALVMEPPETDVMQRPPRPPHEPLLGTREWSRILVAGMLEAGITLGVFVWALHTRDLASARGLAFSVLVFSELFRAFAARSTTRVAWELGMGSNPVLLAVVLASCAIQVALHHVAGLGAVFAILPLTVTDWALCAALGAVTMTVLELAKLARRGSRRGGSGGAGVRAEHVDVGHDADQRTEPIGHRERADLVVGESPRELADRRIERHGAAGP